MRKLLLIGLLLTLSLYALPAAHFLKAEPDAPDGGATSAGQTIRLQADGTVRTLPLESYVLGVLAAEVPADFPAEALRAQAVAARTYALYHLARGENETHPDADLCDDYRHCAAYCEPAQAVSDASARGRLEQAVQDTAGQYLTYDGAPIAAVFHCASAARTESAADVWGEDIPYLQSVVSPGGAACPEYAGDVAVSAADFRAKVRQSFPAADVSGSPDSWFSASVRSEAGGIKTVTLGGVTVTGADVRELFQLHSTNFTITATDTQLVFHTIGYGHGVGLSQYGARRLAEDGYAYAEILSHFYPGTVLCHV